MYSRIGTMLGAGMIALTLCFGCADPNKIETTLQALERGKATGQLILSTDGRISASQQVSLGIGAAGSSLVFSGKIDFSEPLNRPVGSESKE